MEYQKRFEPGKAEDLLRDQSGGTYAGDRRDGEVYVYTEKIVLAVNVALATGRPLLVRGSSGNGKSSLARHVARSLGRRYYEAVITSRTQARDMLWGVDLLLRLHDAQLKGALKQEFSGDMTAYIRPGVLWWGFDRDSAKSLDRTGTSRDPGVGPDVGRAVVLIDEIDKADPDVPNNLLVPLGSLEFEVEEIKLQVKTSAANAPIVFITTNDERELPPAFLRRCIEIRVPDPDAGRLVEIGSEHFPDLKKEFLGKVATALGAPVKSLKDADREKLSRHVSIAEFLDTVRAIVDLKAEPGTDAWKELLDITFAKGREADLNSEG